MRTTPFAIGTLLMIALSASAQGALCRPTTSAATVMQADSGTIGATVGSGEAFSLTFYLVNDACQLEGSCLVSTWVYREMNGVDGLQRHDPVRDDTCRGLYPSDFLVI